MPTSGLRQQAKPGTDPTKADWSVKRSERAVNGGQEGRRERPASGRGYLRADDSRGTHTNLSSIKQTDGPVASAPGFQEIIPAGQGQ